MIRLWTKHCGEVGEQVESGSGEVRTDVGLHPQSLQEDKEEPIAHIRGNEPVIPRSSPTPPTIHILRETKTNYIRQSQSTVGISS